MLTDGRATSRCTLLSQMSYATDQYSKYKAASVPGAFCVPGVNKMRQFSYQGGKRYVLSGVFARIL